MYVVQLVHNGIMTGDGYIIVAIPPKGFRRISRRTRLLGGFALETGYKERHKRSRFPLVKQNVKMIRHEHVAQAL